MPTKTITRKPSRTIGTVLKENILPVPIKDKTPVMSFQDRDVIIAPFSMVRYEPPNQLGADSPIFEMYFIRDGQYWFTRSNNPRFEGGSRPVKVTGQMESVCKAWGISYSSGHYWTTGWNCFSDFSISADTDPYKKVFTKLNAPVIRSGEDRTLLHDGTKFLCYVRPEVPMVAIRSIGLMTSTNFFDWSPIITVLTPDADDIAQHKSFYSMPVIKKDNHYFGFVHVLQTDAGGLDVDQLPPYAPDDNTLSTQLVYSTNGINWVRCNNKKDFIPRVNGVLQQIAFPVIAENKVIIHNLESDRRHTRHEDANPNGRYWRIEKYEISWEDLLKYKP